jgi:DNA end-binding protein Ku
MSRPVWTGSLVFGPLHVPVRLHGAVSPKQVRFHLLHDADGARIQQKRVCSADGEEVPYAQVVKGYEPAPGRYVALTQGELEALEPQARHTVELEDFVELSEIDPLFFDSHYHVMPGEGAWRPYTTLALALRASGRVGLGRFVLHQKGHLCAVRPHGRGLVLSTLHHADELVSQESFSEFTLRRPEEREVESVLRLVEARATSFEPQRYHDLYREHLLAFIERRARSRGLTPSAPEAPPRLPRAVPEEVRGEVRVRQQAARAVRGGAPRKTAPRKKKGDCGAGEGSE